MDAPASRVDVAERELAACMKEAASSDNSEFDLLQYSTARGVDGVDAS